jgi:hypothetical protein
MKRNLGFCIGLFICLTLASASMKTSAAQAGDTWKGASSLSIKITSINEDNPPNAKFVSLTVPITGTIECYMDQEVLILNDEGCYMKFSGQDGTTICFKNVAAIATGAQKNKSDQLLMIGTGDFNIRTMGLSISGIIYFDTKGTLAKDSSGDLTSISLNGKIGGASDSELFFSASLKTTLTK